MPIYVWRCDACLRTVEVIRKLAESDSPPTEEEADGCTNCPEAWVKQIQTAKFVRSTGWGDGKKGSW